MKYVPTNAGNRLRISRRGALAGGFTGGALLLSPAAMAQQAAGSVMSYTPPRKLTDVDHAVVYRREDEFCGWPYISGFWDLGNGELLQNFIAYETDYANADVINHGYLSANANKKFVAVRSSDYGRTWSGDDPIVNIFNRRAAGTENATALSDLGAVDFMSDDVLVANDCTGFSTGEARSFVMVSQDRGNSWSPYLPISLDGLQSLTAIHSYLKRPDGAVLLFMYVSDENGFNRQPVVYELPPGGSEFHFMSFVAPKADVMGTVDGSYDGWLFGGNRWYYPRGYLLPSGRMLCVLRTQRTPRGLLWTELYSSDDGGRTWSFLSRVNDYGAPGSLAILSDGRLVMVYGYRVQPQGIRAKVSEDDGRTWGPELIIRDDGGSWDVGYPNAWTTEDGKVGVLYYINTNHDRFDITGGVRHIARSIFSVD